MRRRLIIYAKRPLAGYAKTRLAADLGAEAAAGVYARLLYTYLLDVARADLDDTEVALSVAAPDDVAFFTAAFPAFNVRPQVNGDLGTRMYASFRRAFDAGAEHGVLTGSDIPGLSAAQVRRAFAALEDNDAVIGPAADGGYYLLGMRAPGADLFSDVTWSTGGVLAQTEARAEALGLSMARLPTLTDIDTIDDYRAWRDAMKNGCSDGTQ
jgi:hypothetical protein